SETTTVYRCGTSVSSSTYPIALPPFPTRRSSDLHLAVLLLHGFDDMLCQRARYIMAVVIQPVGAGLAWLPLRPENIASLAAQLRSEEHTSELQSRENLVCRLLLAKTTRHTRTTPS